jgi:hypothetical protein|tara:strand:- start:21 stop:227 length:207 start_codon:yes stop_codon:yes gene_type:complete
MTIQKLNKIIKDVNKDNAPPKGWPSDKEWNEEEAKKADAAANLGFEVSDFSDDGADLEELKDIIEGNE